MKKPAAIGALDPDNYSDNISSEKSTTTFFQESF
jgi:hypothetical protein